MSDKVAEELAALDKSLGLEVPEEETPPTDEAPSEEETAEEPTEEETPEAPEEAPEGETAEEKAERLYAGKFSSPEELERAYAELQSMEGRRSQELGELRKTVEQLAERMPEDDDDSYVPMDQSTVSWFDTLMEENPVQAMEWARNNDSSGTYYNRGMSIWFDSNPAQAATYQNAVIANALREEFDERLATQTKPLEQQAAQQATNEAWMSLSKEIPDLTDHAEAILQEAKDSPEILRGANTADEKRKALHKLYRLAKGSAAASLETAKQQADTETKEHNRAAKLSGTAPATKAATPEPKSDDDQLLEAIPGFTDYLDKRSAPVE